MPDSRWREKNVERARAREAAWRDKNREAVREYARQWRWANKYNLAPGQYETLWKQQQEVCAICGEVPDRAPHVDHDHACCPGRESCGECVRGILCLPCNAKLATIEDTQWVQKARVYLESS